MKRESLLNRVFASLMHLFSLMLTFVLPLLIYLGTKNRSEYFAGHAKEGMNLHFTFFPILLILNLMNVGPVFTYGLLILESILILIAAIYALKGKMFSYPVIRYFSVWKVELSIKRWVKNFEEWYIYYWRIYAKVWC